MHGSGLRRWAVVSRFLLITLALPIVGLVPAVSHAADCGQELPQSDLSLTQFVSPGEGGNFLYELTVTNHGPSCATGVQIQDFLPPGSSFVGFEPGPPGSWECEGEQTGKGQVVLCVLEAGIPPPPEDNKAVVTIEATAGTGSLANEAVVGGSVTDPDCPVGPPKFCTGIGANNEVWGAFGTSASTGTPNPNFITTTLQRPPNDPASISIHQVAFSSPMAAPVPPPCDPHCLGHRQIVLTTDPTPEGQLMRITITFPVPHLRGKPPPTAYRFDHEHGVWRTLTTCPHQDCDPEVGWVQDIKYDRDAGIVYLVILTSHNGHIAK
jgi:uncharacterized repeat protein (TIGR01451 family)